MRTHPGGKLRRSSLKEPAIRENRPETGYAMLYAMLGGTLAGFWGTALGNRPGWSHDATAPKLGEPPGLGPIARFLNTQSKNPKTKQN